MRCRFVRHRNCAPCYAHRVSRRRALRTASDEARLPSRCPLPPPYFAIRIASSDHSATRHRERRAKQLERRADPPPGQVVVVSVRRNDELDLIRIIAHCLQCFWRAPPPLRDAKIRSAVGRFSGESSGICSLAALLQPASSKTVPLGWCTSRPEAVFYHTAA
jgi:hypothetical protein